MDAISGGFSAFTSQMNEIFQPIASGRQRERERKRERRGGLEEILRILERDAWEMGGAGFG